MNPLITSLIQKTNISQANIINILKLLEEGSTIPFIARYRKEMSGSASNEQLRELDGIYAYAKKLLERKEEILRLIAEKVEMSDEVKNKVEKAQSLQELEDIYRSFKEKKNTRSALAISARSTLLSVYFRDPDGNLIEVANEVNE